MATISDWGSAFLTAIGNALGKIFGFLPDLIGALIILWIGWLIAGIIAKIVAELLRKIKFNQAADHAGLSRFVQSAGVKQDASGLMGEIVKWFFRLLALVAAFSVLQLPALTVALTGILNFIPNLFIALIIILIGALLGRFVGDFVKGAASSAGLSNAGLLSNVARYTILYVAVIAALGQIGIAATVIDTIFIGTVAALALAFGLAFGLGGRETAAQIWQSGYKSAQESLPKLSSGMQQQAKQVGQQAQNGQPYQPRPQTAPSSSQPQSGYNGQYVVDAGSFQEGSQPPPTPTNKPSQPRS